MISCLYLAEKDKKIKKKGCSLYVSATIEWKWVPNFDMDGRTYY